MLEVSKNKEIPAPDPAKPGVERDFGRHVDTGGHGSGQLTIRNSTVQ